MSAVVKPIASHEQCTSADAGARVERPMTRSRDVAGFAMRYSAGGRLPLVRAARAAESRCAVALARDGVRRARAQLLLAAPRREA